MENANLQSRKTVWFVLAIVFYALLILPLSTFSLFREELNLGLGELVLLLFGLSIFVATLLVFLLRLSPGKLSSALELSLMLLAILLSYNFYAGDYGGKVIGADPDVFDQSYTMFEIALFLAVIAAFIVGYRRIKPHYPSIALLMILAAFGNFLALFSASDKSVEMAAERPLMNGNFLDFSLRENVIHIILDGMQGTHFSRILESDAVLKDKFSGFTFFPDALTASEVTYLSLSSIFSGNAWDGRGSIKKYRSQSGLFVEPGKTDVETQSFLEKLANNQFLVQTLVAPGSAFRERSFYDEYLYTEILMEGGSEAASLMRLLDLTLIKVAPWQIKRSVYKNGDWLFSKSSEEQLPRANQVFRFLEEYEKEMSATNPEPVYKLLHLLTPHGPWTTGPDCEVVAAQKGQPAAYAQARCTMLSLGAFMEGLQRLGMYERSMIVIHGDHGICDPRGLPAQRKSNPNIPHCVGNTNPLVMIKPASNDAIFRISAKAVELTDIAPTILDQFSIEHDYLGVNVFKEQAAPPRTRYFYQFTPNRTLAAKQDKVDDVKRYEVTGPVSEAASWCLSSSNNCSTRE